MTYFVCINKHKEGNRIIGYTIIEEDGGRPLFVKSDDLKKAIKEEKLSVTNLTLSSDGKLRDKGKRTSKTSISKEEEREELLRYVAKAKLMGKAEDIPTACNHFCVLAEKDEYNHILYIPDDVRRINHMALDFTKKLRGLKGTLIVIGGASLTDVTSMFSGCKIKFLDFTHFITDNIKIMAGMFENCCVQILDLRSFNTERVVDMSKMFCHCMAKSINLSSFNTPRLQEVNYMFAGCSATNLDVSTLNTHLVNNMSGMFESCFAEKIIFGNFDTSNVQTMTRMFKDNHARTLDLRCFDTRKTLYMNEMFYGSRATTLVLSSFNTKSCYQMNSMFRNGGPKKLDLSTFQLYSYCDTNEMFKECLAEEIIVPMSDERMRKRVLSGPDVPKTAHITVRTDK